MRRLILTGLAFASLVSNAEDCMRVRGDHLIIDKQCRVLLALERLEKQNTELNKQVIWLVSVADQQRKDRETLEKSDRCSDKCLSSFGRWEKNEPEHVSQQRQECFKACSEKYSVPGHC